MATLNLQLANGNCDAGELEDNTGFDGTSNNVNMDSKITGDAENGGFRFAGVTLDSTDTITACGIEPFVRAQDNPVGAWHGHDVDNSVDFVTDADVTTRLGSKTAASVIWDEIDAAGAGDVFVEKLGLEDIITEILARGGWSSGNAITILWLSSTVNTRSFIARSFEHNPAEGCKLNITYTPAAAGGISHITGGGMVA